MQDELLPPHRLFAHSVIEAKPRPPLERLRLALGQACLHREVGLGQERVALQSRPICGGRAIALATGADGFSVRALPTGGAFGLAFALGRAACFAAALALAGGERVDFADLGLAAALADFGLDAGRLAVLDLAVLDLAAGFTDFARAVALPVGLAARFGLARKEGFLLLLFAMSPCFRYYRAKCRAPRPAAFKQRRLSQSSAAGESAPERIARHRVAAGEHGEQAADLRTVVVHLRCERLSVGEGGVVAELFDELDLDLLAVEVAFEIQEIGLEHRLVAAEGWTRADIAGGGIAAALCAVSPRRCRGRYPALCRAAD